MYRFFSRVMTANSSDGIVEADVMRQFLLQCADNYGGGGISANNPNLSSVWIPGEEDEIDDLTRSSSRMGLGSKLEELRRRERELELEEMLQALDLDRDGKVSLNDFIRLLILDTDVEEEEENKEGEERMNNDGNEDDDENGKTRRRREDANGRASSIDRKNTIVHHQETAQERTKGCVIM